MVLSGKYQLNNNIIATYNGIDITQGKGVGTFYAVVGVQSEKFLTANVIPSYDRSTDNSNAIDYDFDFTVQKSFVVEGDCFISVPIRNTAGANPADPTVTVYVRKYDGTTETDLVSQATTNTIATATFEVWTFKVSVPRTHFEAGQVFRLTLDVTVRDSVNETCTFYHDPAELDADSNILTTQLKIDVPMVIE